MRRVSAFLLLLALALGLTACDRLIKEDHLSVSPYVEPVHSAAQTEEDNTPPTVSNRTELRGAVLSFIRDWTEQGLLLVQDYDGDIADDLDETIHYATEEDPIGAYAVDYIDAELTGDSSQGSVSMSIVFRRSAAEIDAIVTVSGNSGAYEKIRQALTAFDVSLTLRIRNFQEADFERYIYSYCLDNPSVMPALPVLSAQVYPQEGETRILELHFGYPVPKEELRLIQNEVQTIMNSSSSYVRSGKDDLESAQLLCRFLSMRFAYSVQEDFPTMPAYELLCQGQAHSFSFASVFYAQSLSAGLECQIVSGTLNGSPHYWNLLCLEDVYYHVDLMRGIKTGERELALLYSETLREEGYAWQEDAYPPAAEAPEPDEDETTAPTEPSQTTEANTQPPPESTAAETTEVTESTEESSTPESSEESSSQESSGSTEPTE